MITRAVLGDLAKTGLAVAPKEIADMVSSCFDSYTFSLFNIVFAAV